MPDETNAQWFAIHTYSGQENKIKTTIEEAITETEWEDKIYKILLPTEEKVEIRKGKKRKVTKKFFPSYLIIKMILDEDSMNFILNVPGVTNFLGINNKPSPLTEAEVMKLVNKIDEKQEIESDKYPYRVNDTVEIIDGPFKTFSGVVDQVTPEKSKLKVMVRIFGRATPVELSFDQVKIES